MTHPYSHVTDGLNLLYHLSLSKQTHFLYVVSQTLSAWALEARPLVKHYYSIARQSPLALLIIKLTETPCPSNLPSRSFLLSELAFKKGMNLFHAIHDFPGLPTDINEHLCTEKLQFFSKSSSLFWESINNAVPNKYMNAATEQ